MMAAIAGTLLDGALPAAASLRAPAIDETVVVVEAAVRGLPPATQRDLDRLFALLAFAPARVVIAGVTRPWAEASPASVDGFLVRWRGSRLQSLRSAYDALHQLVLAAWYGQPRSWAAIGYPGPPSLS